jgi:DNA polymerase-3 subunit gamma/tau
MDLLEIDAASNRGIDAIRDLRERINYAPTDLKRKVYILDEAHQITRDAWNALLKSLEEPPDFVVFMFASTHPQEFPPAILSRLQRFDVRRLTTDEIEGKLRRILEADGRTATPEAVRLIARLAAGGMRDAESMLDQLLSSATDGLDDARVRDLLGLADVETVGAFVDALVATDARAGIHLLDALEERGRDLRGFLDQVIETLRAGIIGTEPPAGLANGALSHSVTDLAAAARRLAAIDPSRAGVGGLRLQLELALFPDPTLPAHVSLPAPTPNVEPAAVAAEARPEPKPTARVAPEIRTAPAAPVRRPESAAAADANTARPRVAPAPARAPQRLASEAAPAEAAPADAAPAEAAGGATAGSDAAPADAAPVASAAAAKAATAAAPGPAGDLAVLRDRWPEIVARISAHPPTKPLIVVCRPISVEDGIVTLGFPEDKSFLRAVAERRRNVLEENISAVLGRSVAVRCVATNIDVVPDLPSDEEAAWILAEARRIFGDEGADPAEVG